MARRETVAVFILVWPEREKAFCDSTPSGALLDWRRGVVTACCESLDDHESG